MNKYENFRSADFIEDPDFRAWVFGRPEAAPVDWEGIRSNSPALAKEMDIARLFLINVEDQQWSVSDAYIQEFGNTILEKHQQTNGQAASPFIRPWYQSTSRLLYLAAAILLTAGLGWVYVTRFGAQATKQNPRVAWIKSKEKLITKTNHSQQPERIALSDGSTVTLHANSSVTYPEFFTGKERQLQLDGEAFFDIRKNPEKPFLVHFQNLTVKVLGTSFNIRSFDREDKIIVTVKTGKVSVSMDPSDTRQKQPGTKALAPVMLIANQEILYQKEMGHFERSVASQTQIVNQTMSEQDFVFSATPLPVIFEKLEKAYGIPVIFDEDQVKDCSLTASLADEPLLVKLDMICKTMDASYEMVDGQIVMHVRSCRSSLP